MEEESITVIASKQLRSLMEAVLALKVQIVQLEKMVRDMRINAIGETK